MTDVRNKYVPPSTDETAFNCPYCGALAKQQWYITFADEMDNTPPIIRPYEVQERLNTLADDEQKRRAKVTLEKIASAQPQFMADCSMEVHSLGNLNISRCFNCSRLAIWVYDQLLWPRQGTAPLPNPDLPDDVRSDYDEASAILDLSPRGAAALLRFGIQRLCKHLGQPGKNINDDIAALVQDGLNPRVQKSLDVVRVVGNNAVHPGQIDLKDDRATAESLFSLVNLIAEIMISQPKHVESMYDNLPESAREAIERRDKVKEKRAGPKESA